MGNCWFSNFIRLRDTLRMGNPMSCRAGCGACCIAPSISSPIPGMPGGKPAGERCVQLTPTNTCGLFGQPGRPTVCNRFSATTEICGTSFEAAFRNLTELENSTA